MQSVFVMIVYRVCLVGFRLWVHLKPGICVVHAAIWLISVNSKPNWFCIPTEKIDHIAQYVR